MLLRLKVPPELLVPILDREKKQKADQIKTARFLAEQERLQNEDIEVSFIVNLIGDNSIARQHDYVPLPEKGSSNEIDSEGSDLYDSDNEYAQQRKV